MEDPEWGHLLSYPGHLLEGCPKPPDSEGVEGGLSPGVAMLANPADAPKRLGWAQSGPEL